MLCKIEKILNLTMEQSTDQKSRERVGREVRVMQLETGRPMVMRYEEPYEGELVTSRVRCVRKLSNERIRVVTGNHIYILKGLGE